MVEKNKIYLGDCLEIMPRINDQSIDMILCDLPYQMTANKWDIMIPLNKLWKEYKRIIKDNGAIVLTACQPFSSMLVMSNLKWFKHEWIWVKEKGSNWLNVKNQPMRVHEHILVFSKKSINYYPLKQNLNRIYFRKSGFRKKPPSNLPVSLATVLQPEKWYLGSNPLSVLSFARDKKKLHPTQKPLGLFVYLINTYTREGDLVLDNCIGSGTTAVACLQTKRHFIGIEINQKYVDIANRRILDNLLWTSI